MGKIKYEDSSHKSLGLAISNTNLDVTDLSVISTKTMGDVEIGVLGASHYVKVKNGDKIFSEVFACRELGGDAIYYPLSTLTSKEAELWGDNFFNYQFDIELIQDLGKIKEMIREFEVFTQEKQGISLKEEFPTKDVVPFDATTYINFRNENSVVEVNSLHTYPEEGIIVYTKSKITKNEN